MTTEGRTGLITRGREVNAKVEDRQMNELSPLVIGPAICENVQVPSAFKRRGLFTRKPLTPVPVALFVCNI